MKQEELKELAKQTIAIIKAEQYTNGDGEVKNLGWYIKSTIANTNIIGPDWISSNLPNVERYPVVEVTTESTIWAMRRLLMYDCDLDELGCLNFASAKHPGGGFTWGTMAQEEALAYSSTLYASLDAAPWFYESHIELEKAGHPPLYTDSVIVSPHITFFRNDQFGLLNHPFSATVLTCAAPKTVDIIEKFPKFLHQVKPVFEQRMERMFRVAIDAGITHFVLGAWGCGVFKNDPGMVATMFKENLEKYGKYFDYIVFAIYGTKDDINYKTFKGIIQP